MVNTKCFFGIHDWAPLKNWAKGCNPRRQCIRCKKRQVSVKLGSSRKWLHN